MYHNLVTSLLILCFSGITLVHVEGLRFIKRYSISNEGATWIDAYIKCQQNGTELASIESAEEQRRFQLAVNRNANVEGGARYWTSGRQGDNISPFVWFVNGRHLTYTDWGPGALNSKKVEHCLEVRKQPTPNNWKWYDVNCSTILRFVCQTKPCSSHWD